MSKPDDVLYIDIETNTEDEEYGVVYIATNDRIGLVINGKTFEELRANLNKALDACLGDMDTLAEYNLTANPHIVLKKN